MYGSTNKLQVPADQPQGAARIVLDDEDKNQRMVWSEVQQHFLQAFGYTIGIGSLVKFPEVCYNNGGWITLVPLLIVLILVGIPLSLLESSLGQFTSLGVISVFRIAPIFKGAGYAIIIFNMVLSSYYCLIMSYSMYYFITSFSTDLPWSHCHNKWNTPNCLSLANPALHNRTVEELINMTSSAEEFFTKRILRASQGLDKPGHVVMDLLFLNFVTLLVCFLCVANGIKSLGKIIYFTVAFPYIVEIAFIIRGFFLPGAMDGMRLFFSEDWTKLTSVAVWGEVALQLFFVLGSGCGGAITIASYNPFNNNCFMPSLVVPFLTSLSCIITTLVVFMGLGYITRISGLPINALHLSGPKLTFVTLPTMISMMPLPQLWGILFFSMLYILGLNEMILNVETIITSLVDEHPHISVKKPVFVFMLFIALFILSLACSTNGGYYVVTLIDNFIFGVTPGVVAFITTVVIGWTYGAGYFLRDIEFMLSTKLSIIWKIMWVFITPAFLVFIVLASIVNLLFVGAAEENRKPLNLGLGWVLALLSTLPLPTYALYKVIATKGKLLERITFLLSPAVKYGPARPRDMIAWRRLCRKSNTGKYFDTQEFELCLRPATDET